MKSGNLSFKQLEHYLLTEGKPHREKLLSRTVRYVRYFWKALLSFFFQDGSPRDIKSCDVLLIHPSEKSYKLGRKHDLIAALRAKGLHVEEFVEGSDSELVRLRQFATPKIKVPFILRWPAAHASYLLERYEAKVILTERNGWVLPSFIKIIRANDGAKVVHMAHSVLTGQSSKYCYFDYDYYLIFGKSSYDYLAGLHNTFGECVAHFAGPYFFSDRLEGIYESEVKKGGGIKCLFLGAGPDYELTQNYLESCMWLIRWLEENETAELWVKLHPRSKGAFWRNQEFESKRINILDAGFSLSSSAGQFDLVFSGYTNAVVDISRFSIPFVLLGSDEDYFSVRRFGIPQVRSFIELSENVRSILENPTEAKRATTDFFEFHVRQRTKPLGSVVEALKTLIEHGELNGAALKGSSKF